MVEEVLPDLYRVEVPLPGNPLKALNSYVIRGPDRSLVIDTGMNRPECREVLGPALRSLGIQMERADVFVTHLHADHSGLASWLATASSRVYCSAPDGDWLNTESRWQEMLEGARRHGFPEEALSRVLASHPARKYGPVLPFQFEPVSGGDVVRAGRYSFHCIATPGHTEGHICLYEAEARVLLAGDHVLGDITPNISAWFDGMNPLGSYLASLERVRGLPVDVVLPGHRRIFHDLPGRIAELEHHHEMRTREVLHILQSGAASGYEIASWMKWDMTYKSWEEFPVPQKWFATGEALAHLRYLEGEGQVRREDLGGRVVFRAS